MVHACKKLYDVIEQGLWTPFRWTFSYSRNFDIPIRPSLCVCAVCIYVYVYIYGYMCLCMWRPESSTGSFLLSPSTLFFRGEVSHRENLEPMDRLGLPEAPAICLLVHAVLGFFIPVLGLWTLNLMLAEQGLYPLSLLPSSKPFYLYFSSYEVITGGCYV